MDLSWKCGCELRIFAKDVRVGCVSDQDEAAMGEGFKDFVKKEPARGKDFTGGAEGEGTCVEGAEGVVCVDEVHVHAGGLLWGRGQVVEVVRGAESGRV